MVAASDKILSLAQGRVFRAKELTPLGIARYRLRELVEAGRLTHIGRGLYMAADAEITENQSLVEVAAQCHKGVFCLLTALRFHGLTTENPESVYLLLPKGWQRPMISHTMLDVFWASGESYSEGIEEHVISGVTVKATSPAKTVADCFKFRSSIGVPVAVEALREVWQKKKATADELWRFAKICRMTQVMRPYFEAILS
jgi:predicted transcriptional regulator of viral defense system